jgi:transcriptional regulator with XRE-family HTH domain
MTKPSDKKLSGSTQGQSRASANKAGSPATEPKKPQSKTRTPAKKPAVAKKPAAAPKTSSAATKPSSKARSTATSKQPAAAPASEAPAAAVTPKPERTESKSRRPRISAQASANTQAQPKTSSQVAPSPQSTEDAAAPERKKIECSRLIKMIKKAIIERGLQDRAIADIVGVTQIYWNSLANGNRQIKSLGKEKLQKIAEFLGLPLIQVYLLAEAFTAEDFFNSKDLNEQLWLSIRKMQEDPQWAGYAPSAEEWEQIPINVRITLVSLYERESKRYLMAKAEVEVPGNNFNE